MIFAKTLGTTENVVHKKHGASRGRNPQLDALRAVAVIAVIVQHTSPGRSTMWGSLGVNLFFVLSGFLITRVLLNTSTEKGFGTSWKQFMWRRMFRLMPAYYTTLVLGLALGISAFWDGIVWHLLYLTNWWAAWSGGGWGVGHFWSLAIEEQFYLFWPVVILLLRGGKKTMVFVGLLGALFVVCTTGYAQAHLTPAAFPWLCAGSWLAFGGRVNKPVALISLGLATAYYVAFWDMGAIAQLGFVLPFTLLVQEASDRRLGAWSESPVLCRIGLVSYGIYLYHQPFGVMLPMEWKMTWLPSLFVVFPLTWLMAEASWHLIEQPFLRLRPRQEARSQPWFAK